MEKLPTGDTAMLVSAINFLLRDKEFDNLDQICTHYHLDPKELTERLAKLGMQYDSQNNRIW